MYLRLFDVELQLLLSQSVLLLLFLAEFLGVTLDRQQRFTAGSVLIL